AEDDQSRKWRVRFAGQSLVHLEIQSHERQPLVLAHLTTQQELAPNRVEAHFLSQVEGRYQNVRELHFACDPGLDRWEVRCLNSSVDLKWRLDAWTPDSLAGCPVPVPAARLDDLAGPALAVLGRQLPHTLVVELGGRLSV